MSYIEDALVFGVPNKKFASAYTNSLTDLKVELSRRRKAALSRNPRSLPELGAAVTVAVGTTEFPINMYTRTPNSPSSEADWAKYCVFEGGWTAFTSPAVYVFSATRQDPTGVTPVPTGGQSTTTARQTCARIRFTWVGTVARFALNASAALKARFLVNGQYVSFAGSLLNSGMNYVSLDFGSYDSRDITVELTGGAATSGGSDNNAVAFGRFYPGRTDIVRAPAPTPPLRLGVFGDSITAGPSNSSSNGVTATMAGDSFARIMGDWLGIDDVWCSGIGGTGYIYRSVTQNLPSLTDRLADITGNSFDIIAIFMGINDAPRIDVDFTAAQFGATVAADLAAIRAAHPTTPIVVFGPWMGATGQANIPIVQVKIQAAVDAMRSAGDKRIAFVPTFGAAWSNITFTGALNAATSATLTAPYAGVSRSDAVIRFVDANGNSIERTGVTVTNGSTAVSWSTGAVTAVASASLYSVNPQDSYQSGSGRTTAPNSGTLAFTGALTSATSATLTSAFTGVTRNDYVVLFYNGTSYIERTGVTLTNGSTAVSWGTGAVTANATAQFTNNSVAGNSDVFLYADGTHPNDAGRNYLGQRGGGDIYASVMPMP